MHKIAHHFKKVNHAALDSHKHLKPDVKAKFEKDLVSHCCENGASGLKFGSTTRSFLYIFC